MAISAQEVGHQKLVCLAFISFPSVDPRYATITTNWTITTGTYTYDSHNDKTQALLWKLVPLQNLYE